MHSLLLIGLLLGLIFSAIGGPSRQTNSIINSRNEGTSNKLSNKFNQQHTDHEAQEQRVAVQIVTTESGRSWPTRDRLNELNRESSDNPNAGISFDDQYIDMEAQLNKEEKEKQQIDIGNGAKVRIIDTSDRSSSTTSDSQRGEGLRVMPKRVVINLDSLVGNNSKRSNNGSTTRVTIGFEAPQKESEGSDGGSNNLGKGESIKAKKVTTKFSDLPSSQSSSSSPSANLMSAIKRQGGIPTYIDSGHKIMLQSEMTSKSRQKRNQRANPRVSIKNENSNLDNVSENRVTTNDMMTFGLDQFNSDNHHQRHHHQQQQQQKQLGSSSENTGETNGQGRRVSKFIKDLPMVTTHEDNSLSARHIQGSNNQPNYESNSKPRAIQAPSSRIYHRDDSNKVATQNNIYDSSPNESNYATSDDSMTNLMMHDSLKPSDYLDDHTTRASSQNPSSDSDEGIRNIPIERSGSNTQITNNSQSSSSSESDDRIADLLERLKLFTTKDHLLGVARELERDGSDQVSDILKFLEPTINPEAAQSAPMISSTAMDIAEARNRVPAPIVNPDMLEASASANQIDESDDEYDRNQSAYGTEGSAPTGPRYNQDFDSEQGDFDEHPLGSETQVDENEPSLGLRASASSVQDPTDHSRGNLVDYPREDQDTSALEEIIDELVRRENEADARGVTDVS